jgi:hypothetical protein
MIVQKNLYAVARNLNNLCLNVDANRLGDDNTFISVQYNGTNPAIVTVKVGSSVEVNGNLYTIEVADEVFTMANRDHKYIIFDGTTFSSASTRGTENPLKCGWYQSDLVNRTLKWKIDQHLSGSQNALPFNNVINIDSLFYIDTLALVGGSVGEDLTTGFIVKKPVIILCNIVYDNSYTTPGDYFTSQNMILQSYYLEPARVILGVTYPAEKKWSDIELKAHAVNICFNVSPGYYRMAFRGTVSHGTPRCESKISIIGCFGDKEISDDVVVINPTYTEW